ncbi:hypothetical protein BGZ72_002707 [Mortierella alpina]|nr:hypothetical protein BGZ72_002707 [Mortierella alpina]
MDTLKEDLIDVLEKQGRYEQAASCSKEDALEGNTDPQLCTNTSIPCRPRYLRGTSVSSTASTTADNSTSHLPPEIWLNVLRQLTVSQLLSCHLVSRLFRSMARTTMMDKLGARFMETQRWPCRKCREDQRQQQQLRQYTSPQRGQTFQDMPNGRNGLPPLPHNHLSTATISIISSLLQYPMSEQEYPQPSQSSHSSQSDHHHHHQFVEGPSSTRSHSPACAHEAAQRARTRSDRQPAGFVAPGTIALILFPTNEHATASWQQRQRVHLWCTGIDRLQEQLIFSPTDPEENFFKFNTSSYSLSSSHLFTSNGDSASGSRDVGWRVSGKEYTGFAPGQKVFDYQTGKPTTDTSGTGGYDFIKQFSGSETLQRVDTSEQLQAPPPTSSSSNGSVGSIGSTSISAASTSSIFSSAHSRRSSWTSVSGYGGDHHSVIGVQHGDWFEDPAAFSGGMWSGINSVSERETMVFMPWTLPQTTLRDERMQPTRGRWSWEPNMEQSSPLGGRFHQATASVSTGVDLQASSEIHKHHVHLSNHPKHTSATKHHHRFFCLHHDQIMADVAAANNAALAMDSRSDEMGGRKSWSSAGSKHLKIYYETEVKESNRCLYCISSPCKATLEIKLKVYQLKVSLDWILSGISPEPNQKKSAASDPNSCSKDRGPGQLPT